MPAKLLQNLKVADFGWGGVGPITTKILADYGAEVIKIEGRTRPDVERLARPFKDDIPGMNRAGYFNAMGTSKMSFAISLAHPKGVEVAKKLVVWADIVVENFAGGVMERMGLSYEELVKVKPDIIMLSSCMMGQTGPQTRMRGWGVPLTAIAGINHITGWPDRQPVGLGVYTDYIAPRFNILAIFAALDYRRRTGKGVYLDMSQYENVVHFMAPLILDNILNQRVADRTGNRINHAAPHGVYRCKGKDRWCTIAVFTNEEWINFCQAIGDPNWTKDSRFATLAVRKENEDELDRLVEEWTVDYSAEVVMTSMQAAGISAGVVATCEDLLEHDPQLRHRHFYTAVNHPEIGEYRAQRAAFLLSECQYEVRTAPLLGEHNEYICREIIGLSDDEIAELVIEGVLE